MWARVRPHLELLEDHEPYKLLDRLLGGKPGLLDQKGNEIFATAFGYLSKTNHESTKAREYESTRIRKHEKENEGNSGSSFRDFDLSCFRDSSLIFDDREPRFFGRLQRAELLLAGLTMKNQALSRCIQRRDPVAETCSQGLLRAGSIEVIPGDGFCREK